ncbi:MAG: hypothetical protein A2583_03990 [Bdellovibrionales bacterium RIFOXYD1_FULL_53_11]|nr:MAG: hypothetical protein A2583_03990 [Bdellovibrionales bacterium RIFOXYD1_FULL_53_11]
MTYMVPPQKVSGKCPPTFRICGASNNFVNLFQPGIRAADIIMKAQGFFLGRKFSLDLNYKKTAWH